MPKYNIYWDEIVTYCVEVEAESTEEAWDTFSDPGGWLTEPDVVKSDYADNWEIEEI